MPFNPTGRQQIAWSGLFGLNTEVKPPDLPQGLSPDNQDVSYVPGKSGTRPAAAKILSTNLGSVGVTFIKTLVQPNGDSLNLELDSLGNMNMQDVGNSPNVTTVPFTVTPGVYASSIPAFNREYFAFHDGYVAKDIPRSFDGTDWFRLTQDAVATNTMTASDAAITTFTIVNIVPKPQINITTITLGDGFATVITATSHGLAVGDHVLISGNSVFQYNGQQTVASVPNPTTFTFDTLATGLLQGTGGTAIPDTVTVTTTIPNGLISGETITITGNSDSNYNNSSGVSANTVGLVPGTVCDFIHIPHGFGGGFPYGPGGTGGPWPGPVATYTLTNNQSLMFNPGTTRCGANFLPGTSGALQNINPMNVFGVNASGSWDGTQVPIWSAAAEDWGMAVLGSLTFSAAGTYYFRMSHDDGAFIGMGGGISSVSGPTFNPFHQTATAVKSFPIMAANNASTSFGHVCYYSSVFAVSVPAAGTYPFEIDYTNWEKDRFLALQYSKDAGVTYVAITPGNAAFATPATWTVGNVINGTQFQFDAVYAVGTGTGGTLTVGGLIAPGPHQVVCYFETETDSFTAPSPPITWNSAGSKRVVLSGVPIGPPNVKARWFAFTGASGANFFTIPVPARDPQTGQQVSTSTVLNDNTSTTVTFDFADNTLFEGLAIDITGNNLFAQVTLGPCANITAYSNRLAVWGDTNNIKNLRSMGFEGGIPTVGSTTPLWWKIETMGGQLVPGEFGFGWQITGNGTSSQIGRISQPAFEDYLFQPILTPSTQYTWELISFTSAGAALGNIVAEIYSATGGGVLASATIPTSTLGVGLANAKFVQADFSATTPAVIPADTVIRYYGTSLGNGQQVVLDETMMVFTAQPTVPGQMRFSYAFNPEAFDGVTGVRSIEYSETVLDAKILRDNFYVLSEAHLSRTQDNGIGEPSTWTNYTVSDKAGGLSLRCFDVGEGWAVFASNAGLYMFSGGEPVKISQEIQTLWSAIDPNLKRHVWIKNDLTNRRIHIGVPLVLYAPTGTTFTPQSCNKQLVVDYRELNSSSMIENAPPLHISMTGRMLSSDLTRKWSVWNLPMNCADIMTLPGDEEPQICFGSGLGNGVATGFGNFYRLDEGLYADSDYGVIGSYNGESTLTYKQWLVSGPANPANPLGTRPAIGTVPAWRPRTSYYMTYLSPSHEEEQQLQIGSQRKLYEYLEVYCPGIGNLNVLAHINNIANPTNRPPAGREMNLEEVWDLEFPLNLKAQRLALLFYPDSQIVIPPVVVIDIEPETLHLSSFNTHQFTYTLSGTPTLNVTWSTSGGSITSGGLYTAPGPAGTYSVTVTSVDDPSAHDSAVVTVAGDA